MVELIAGCEDLSEGYARALQALRQLTQAGLEGRGMSATVLHAYHEQAEAAAAGSQAILGARRASQSHVHGALIHDSGSLGRAPTNQERAESVARQIEHARAYATTKGWTVSDEHIDVDDGISGAEFERRPAFLRMMNALKPRPTFTAIVMSEESRRDQVAGWRSMRRCRSSMCASR